MAGNSAEPGRSVTSKLAAIVTAFTGGSRHTLSEVAGETGLAVSTVHRLLTDLVTAGLLERAEGGEYRVAQALRSLPTKALGPTLRQQAPFVVDDLAGALHTTARLGVFD